MNNFEIIYEENSEYVQTNQNAIININNCVAGAHKTTYILEKLIFNILNEYEIIIVTYSQAQIEDIKERLVEFCEKQPHAINHIQITDYHGIHQAMQKTCGNKIAIIFDESQITTNPQNLTQIKKYLEEQKINKIYFFGDNNQNILNEYNYIESIKYIFYKYKIYINQVNKTNRCSAQICEIIRKETGINITSNIEYEQAEISQIQIKDLKQGVLNLLERRANNEKIAIIYLDEDAHNLIEKLLYKLNLDILVLSIKQTVGLKFHTGIIILPQDFKEKYSAGMYNKILYTLYTRFRIDFKMLYL